MVLHTFCFLPGLQEYVEAYSFYYYILSERLVEWKEVGVHCIGSLPFYCLCQYSLPTLVSSPILFLGLSCHCQQQQRIFLPKSFCFPPSSMGKKTGLEMRKLLERGRTHNAPSPDCRALCPPLGSYSFGPHRVSFVRRYIEMPVSCSLQIQKELTFYWYSEAPKKRFDRRGSKTPDDGCEAKGDVSSAETIVSVLLFAFCSV